MKKRIKLNSTGHVEMESPAGAKVNVHPSSVDRKLAAGWKMADGKSKPSSESKEK